MPAFTPRPLPRRHVLQEVAEPNLLRETFPYTEVPRVYFDPDEARMDPAPEIWITDTTFRDGQQARDPYTVEQIVRLYDLLARLDGGTGVIRQSEFFLYSEKDREAVRRCRELGHRYPEITGWIRAVKADFALVREMGLPETGILTSCSDYHIFHKLRWTRAETLCNYLEIVDAALEAGVTPRCHFEDVTRADIYGFVVPFAIELMKRAEESKRPIKIRLCDTMGVAVPWPAASLPRGVPKLVQTLRREAGVPPQQLEWHGHNDLFKVHANSATAWLYGCSSVNTTLLSTGERTGNSPLEAALVEYIGLTGDTRIDTRILTEIAVYMREECGVPIPDNYPLLGRDFNTTRAGIHIDGLLKDREIYTLFDTEKLLNRPIGIAITDKSGAAGVAYWLNIHPEVTGGRRFDKSDAVVQNMYREIQQLYDAGRTTHMREEELAAMARRHLAAAVGG